MTDFQTFTNSGNGNSGEPSPGCGVNQPGPDFWFEVVANGGGNLYIVTLAGTMTNAAMAIYEGSSCSDLTQIACLEDDLCNNSIMPITNLTGLNPGQTYYIRLWPEAGANGDFQIRVSDGPLTPPIYTLNGTAAYDAAGCLQLTSTQNNQLGCAWAPDLADFSQPFTNTVTMYFGTNDAGADGICMIYQNNGAGSATCGQGGEFIGAGPTVTNSFIVEFDTFQNGSQGDPAEDHVAVNVNGDMGAPIAGPNTLGNIEDGQEYEVTFTWDPATNFYEIFFNGNLELSGNYDIINNCFGGATSAYFGFTSSTGGANNLQYVCTGDGFYPAGALDSVAVVICEGDSYFAGGANQTTTGIYTDVLTAFNGCDSLVITDLSVIPAVAMVANPDMIDCNDPNSCVTLDGSSSTVGPNVTYLWTASGGGAIQSGANTLNPVVCFAGSYTLTVSNTVDGVLCTSEQTVVVLENDAIPPSPTVDGPNLVCFGDLSFYEIFSNPAYTNITWYDPVGGEIIGGQGTEVVTIQWDSPVVEEVCCTC